jgi:hypothetical protein
MELKGFKRLYSSIVKDHFLGTWISDDREWMIEVALRGGGYNVRPMKNDPNNIYYQTPYGSTIFDNLPTLEEAYKTYLKYANIQQNEILS